MTTPIRVVDLGRQAYAPVLDLQRALVRARLDGALDEDLLLLVEHEPVVTFGRGTRQSSVPVPAPVLEARGFAVADVERGGDVTVHAPGQLVGYPIVDLEALRPDLHWYLRQLEQGLIAGLAALGLAAGRNPGLTGVWSGGRKIASIGVHVKRWVTLHGFALNVCTDLAVFDVVVPCGIPGVVMTSVARELGTPAEQQRALWHATRDTVVDGLGAAFERRMRWGNLPDLPGISEVPLDSRAAIEDARGPAMGNRP